MVRQTMVRLIDDLDGSDAQLTVRFGWDGIAYEIDLTSEHAEAFAAAVRPYLDAARRVGPGRRRARRSGTTGGGARPARSVGEQAAIRGWARNHGFQLADRGRIPRHVLEAYQGAQQEGAPSPAAAPSPSANRTRSAPARKSRGQRRAGAKAVRSGKATAKKTSAKKATAKNTSAKKPSARKAAAKKAAAKKSAVKKSAATKTRRGTGRPRAAVEGRRNRTARKAAFQVASIDSRGRSRSSWRAWDAAGHDRGIPVGQRQ